jgi:hypothetical protein
MEFQHSVLQQLHVELDLHNLEHLSAPQLAQIPHLPYQELVDRYLLEPRQLMRFMHLAEKDVTLKQYLQRLRKPSSYVRPKERDTSIMNPNFLEYQLIAQDRQEGGIAGCIRRIRERRFNDNIRIPQLEWIEEEWKPQLDMEQELYEAITYAK